MNERSIFAAALDIADPAQRQAYLDEACANDPPLRRHIDGLLAAEGKLGSFLARPHVEPDATGAYAPLTARPGTLIGPYKLMELIGEGGMGLVYVAEQQHPVRRKVALKLIKPGMDTRDVIARFEAERQALALMDHPNIAKVLDAGTVGSEQWAAGSEEKATSLPTADCPLPTSPRPYFVMELVKGIPITDYCDQNQLTPAERLELFIDVCRAVQHAHTKGVIHRDLKPSNILIAPHDGKPVVKVIDFGVAKAVGQPLTDKTIYTRLTQMIGTPLYMSPEQAEVNALDVDTRGDIYALGVLLYELLTGTTPFDRQRFGTAAFDEIRRIIREEEPPKPSTRLSTLGHAMAAVSAKRKMEPGRLSALVRGDLDWIVMKCLEKDRTRRYETATGLAQDIQHYLADEPVLAGPPTAGYKLRKFARKHRRLLATAAAFAALLLLGATGSTWQAVRATQAEGEALTERDEKEQARQAEAKHRAAAVLSEQVAQQQRDKAQKQGDEVRVLNEQLQRTLYAAHMNLAHHAWESGGVERVRELLDQHRPKKGESDLRGFEWNYLHRLCQAQPLTLKGHTHFVWSVAYSPDGKRLASAGGGVGSEVKMWDAQTGQELFSLKDAGSRVAFSPNGKRLASSGRTGVKLWDAQTGQELLTLKGHSGYVTNVAFSLDGKHLASASRDQTVKVWDAHTGQELLSLKGHTGEVDSVAFSPDGKRLASASDDKTVKVWDAQTGQVLLTIKGGETTVAFSPDGKRLASASPGKTVKVWDAQTGQELLTIQGHSGSVRCVAFSPDGKRLASASLDNTVKVWDAQSGQERFTLKGHTDRVWSVAFSPDGKRLASASLDKMVKVWEPQHNPESIILKSGRLTTLSPDFRRLASAAADVTDNTVKVWDVRSGNTLTLEGHTAKISCLAFSPDGKRLVSASRDRTVVVWDAQTGEQLRSLKGHSTTATEAAFSPDGQRLASAGYSHEKGIGELKVWDAQTGQGLLTIKRHTWQVTSIAFSPDGKRLASGGGRLEQGKALSEMKVWDALTGQELLSLKGNAGFVYSVAFSPDGKHLTGVFPGNAVKVWDAQTGQEILTLKGHNANVSSVAFSPDGKRLASASSDKAVKVWDAQTGQELLTLQGVGSLAFSVDGHRLAAVAADGTVTIWDATPVMEKPSPKPGSR